uniref:Uncharacterized protein n=1 Tax=Rhizophora mucronata TaxID=61149 RepID=A0A2P2MEK9_RHIMU
MMEQIPKNAALIPLGFEN